MITKKEALHGAIVRLNDTFRTNHVRYPGKLHLRGGPNGHYLCDGGDELKILYGVRKFGIFGPLLTVSPLKDPSVVAQLNWDRMTRQPSSDLTWETFGDDLELVVPGQKFVSPWHGQTAIKPVDAGSGLTAAGLSLNKKGRLKYPIKVCDSPKGYNCYGQPFLSVGDYCCDTSNGGLSAGTVGKITSVNYDDSVYDGSFRIQMLDGHIESAWRHCVGSITEEQVQEVVDFYLADGRADRLFVKF